MFMKLDDLDLDALREVSNIGAGHAVTALHQMTHRTIDLEVTRVDLIPFADVVERLGGPEEEIMGLFFRVFGTTRGNMLVVMPRSSVDHLLGILFNREGRKPLGDMEISALKEAGNILTSSYLSAVATILRTPLMPSIPGFAMDMAQAVVDMLLIELAEVGDEALVIQTDFSTRDGSFSGHFFLLPDPSSIEMVLRAIGKLQGGR